MSQSVEVTREEIGDRVRRYRLKHGWTDEELGQMIGLSGGTLNSKERGVRDFTWNEAIRLSDVFEITLEELIRGVEPGNLGAHRKTGLSNDAVSALQNFYEVQSLQMVKGLNMALSFPYVLDALGRYMCFVPTEKGYYLSEKVTNGNTPLVECKMSQALYYSVLGQNLLHVLNAARRRDYRTKKHFEAIEDFSVDDDDEDESKLAEPSAFDLYDKDSDNT